MPFVLGWFPSNEPRRVHRRRGGRHRRHDRALGSLVGALSVLGRVARAGAAFAAHTGGADVRTDRRHRRRAHYFVAGDRSAVRATGTTDTAGCATRRSRSRRFSSAASNTKRCAGANGCCAPRPAIRRRCRRCTASRGERRLTELELDWLPGYEGSAPGPHRQRRALATATRRVRRTARRVVAGDARGHAAEREHVVARAAAARACWKIVGANPTRASGKYAVRGATSRTRRCCAGSRSIARSRWSSRPATKAPSIGGARYATRSTPKCATRATTPSSARSPSASGSAKLDVSMLMIPLVGFLPGDDPACAFRPSTPSGATSPTTVSCAATTPPTTSRSTASANPKASSCRAASGWSRRSRWPASTTRRGTLFDRLLDDVERPRPVLGGVRPEGASGSSATSRRPSRTSRWSPPRTRPLAPGTRRRNPQSRPTVRAKVRGRRFGATWSKWRTGGIRLT